MGSTKHHRKKTYILFGLLSLIIIGYVYYAEINHETVMHTIELRKDGFHPEILYINRGDVVQFTSIRGLPFWPASDAHPTHSVYTAFDPKRPLAPEETWEFTFDTRGEWEYHDHLYSFFTGTIIVQ